MSDVAALLAGLTPEQRDLLMMRLNRQAKAQPDGSRESQIRRRAAPAATPLSYAQERLWFMDQLEPGNVLFNMPVAVRLIGQLDTDALERSLGLLVERHEMLRTIFPLVDGQPMQVITPSVQLRLTVFDLQALSASMREAQAAAYTQREAQRPFDLARGPLIRATLLRFAADDHVLVLVTHHIASDGWSTAILMRDLAALYSASAGGVTPDLPVLPIQYADYAAWQRSWLQGEVLQRQLAYWTQQLAGAPPLLDLPADRPRPPAQRLEGARLPLRLAPALSRQLRQFCREQSITPFMVLLAAFQIVLSHASGQDDIVVGVPVANRTRREVEQLIGFFVNTLALRTNLSGNPSFGTLLDRVRTATLGAQNHQDVPFERLVEALAPQRDRSHTPIFQAMFILQNTPTTSLDLPGLTLAPLDIDTATAKYDITLRLAEGADGFEGWFEYRTDLFEQGTIAALGTQLLAVLQQGLDAPGMPLSALDLPPLPQAARPQRRVACRGYLVDLDAIERVLRADPAVTDAAVVPVTESEAALAAYVAGSNLSEGALVRQMQAALPAFMLPQAVVILPYLPRDGAGALDLAALPAPATRRDTSEIVAPRTPTEELLVAIWSKVLHREQIGVYDNFFDLGGHSLMATQVISRVLEAFVEPDSAGQAELEGILVSTLFEAPTIAALAERIDVAQQGRQGEVAPPIVPIGRDRPLPLSFAQERLWFLDQLDPGNPFYNELSVVRLTGQLDLAALEQAINALAVRHEILRTTFTTHQDSPVQVSAPDIFIPLTLIDLEDVPLCDRERRAFEIATDETRCPFDLVAGPLIRTTLLRMAPDDHVLILTMHHIICDGWTVTVLLRETADLYAAISSGRSADLAPLPIQYADYAAWQRSWLQGEVLQRQLAYWTGQLANMAQSIDLPTDRPRPPVPTFGGERPTVSLSQELSAELRAFCRREGVTPFMVLLAVFQLLLARYSGQDDIAVGSPIANRNRREIEPLMGFFANTLVLRTNLGGNPTFRELLQRVRTVALEGYAHQDLPFEHVVEAIAPRRDRSRNPLFHVMFVLQNLPVPVVELPGLTLRPMEVDNKTSKFDLTLELFDLPEAIHGCLEYSTDLFDAATIDRMIGHFVQLLGAVLARPADRLSEFTLLDTPTRQLLTALNATGTPYPDRPVHALVADQAARTPDAIAVRDAHAPLTYQALDLAANQLACALQDRGVGPGTIVAVCLPRTPALVVALLAVLKAGGAYLPLDPSDPPARMSALLADAQATLLITDAQLQPQLPPHAAPQFLLDLSAFATTLPVAAPDSPISLDQPAYLLYTSGSTGRPKGVLGLHRGLVNRLHWMSQTFPAAPHEAACHKTTLSFVDAVAELWWPLTQGLPLALISPQQLIEPLAFVERLAAEQVSRLVLVPSVLQLLLDELPDLAERLPRLWLWICSGEALPPPLARQFAEQMPGRTLLNIYGSTEVAADVTAHTVTEIDGTMARVPIGQPIANNMVYILDAMFQPVGVGVVGELHIGGASLARGYLNQPAQTAARFVPDPFSGTPGARMYRTGDRARLRPDGRIEIVGRVDQQIKLRGMRLDLGEVEAALRQLPGVLAAAVVAPQLAHRPGDQQLVAYVSGDGLDSERLRADLAAALPAYMLPQRIVLMAALPQTASGKVDRRALEGASAMLASTQEYVAPRTPAEQVFADIWAQVLGLDRVGVHDNFFDVGGHSLLATQVILRINDLFRMELPVHHVFDSTTVAELVQAAVANEPQPGQVERIAQVLLRIRKMDPAAVRQAVQHQRAAH